MMGMLWAFFTTTYSSSMLVPLSTNTGMGACMMVNQHMILSLWPIPRHQHLEHEHMHQLLNPRQHRLLPDQDHPLQHFLIEHSQLWQSRGVCSHFDHQGQVTSEPEYGSDSRQAKEIFPVIQKELGVVKNHQQPRRDDHIPPCLETGLLSSYPAMEEMYISFYF